MTRVFIAGIFHETHSFTGTITGLDEFVIHRGQEILQRRGDASQVDGFLSVAEREGWEVVPGAVYTGGASGTVDHAVFEAFWAEVKPASWASVRSAMMVVVSAWTCWVLSLPIWVEITPPNWVVVKAVIPIAANGAIGAAQVGSAIAISRDGNTMIVGAPADNGGVGGAFVYVRVNGAWLAQGSKLLEIGRAHV